MFRIIGIILRFGILALIILDLGNLIQWRGKTISDQVKTHMSHAERSPLLGEVKTWSGKVLRDSENGIRKNLKNIEMKNASSASEGDEIPPSERQKLRALIRELNGSRGKN